MSRIGAIVKKTYGSEIRNVDTPPGNGKASAASKDKAINASRTRPSKSGKKLRWVGFLVLIIAMLALAGQTIFHYNRFSGCYTVILAKRAGVEREMQRRANLMPNLVKVVNEYVVYEQRMFKYITDSGTYQLGTSLTNSTLDKNNPLEKTLSRMLATVLHWPELKGTHSVQDLIKEAANTEDRVATSKEEYNKACETYNQYLSIFPGDIFGYVFGFRLATYIGIGQEPMEVPDLNLTIPATIIMPESDNVTASASDPISQMKAEFIKQEFAPPDEPGPVTTKPASRKGMKK